MPHLKSMAESALNRAESLRGPRVVSGRRGSATWQECGPVPAPCCPLPPTNSPAGSATTSAARLQSPGTKPGWGHSLPKNLQAPPSTDTYLLPISSSEAKGEGPRPTETAPRAREAQERCPVAGEHCAPCRSQHSRRAWLCLQDRGSGLAPEQGRLQRCFQGAV